MSGKVETSDRLFDEQCGMQTDVVELSSNIGYRSNVVT